MSGHPCDKYGEAFHSLNATGTIYGDAMLEQVTEWVLSNEVKESANQSKSEWNYVRIPSAKAPPTRSPHPTSPPTLCKPSNKTSESKVD